MKTYSFSSLFFIALILFAFTSCRNSDNEIENNTPGNLQIKFENGFLHLGNIVLNQTTQTSTNGQKHKFSTLKYIVSNITLIDENGNEVKYHYNDPDRGAFIIDQAQAIAGVSYLNLSAIPKGRYKKIKFGLGISPQAYLLGLDGQGEFWDKAKTAGMAWSWAAGYIFTKIEGQYGSSTAETEFRNHAGNMGNPAAKGTPDLYREITLELPTTARVSQSVTPSIHILADFNHFLSGAIPLTLDETNASAMGSSPHLVRVTDNLSQMFIVDHVHND
ncbi:MbnP family protein [Bergeyella sp. RCAD1439]|uniref:MbnP family protein n=1 Tax=Bergeyella anatis TaxID=3113737 RepID=UPI002E1772D3|nr:MbnP family protein [Bergeyella sp. RCAD1439]